MMTGNKEIVVVGRLIAIGDIHGCHIELQELLDIIQPSFDSGDDVWAVGDAFDRAGPKCAMEVYKIFKKYDIKYLYGNHDGELKDKIINNKTIHKPWFKDWWDSFDSEAKEWFLAAEKYYHFYDKSIYGRDVLLVHAGIDPEKDYEYLDPRVLCTIQCVDPMAIDKRLRYFKAKKDWSNRCNYWPNWFKPEGRYQDMDIVFGHTPHMPHEQCEYRPLDKLWIYAVDSGCCRGGFLSAYILDKDVGVATVCRVKAKKDYYFESYKNH